MQILSEYPLVSIDLETTGVEHGVKVIEFGAVLEDRSVENVDDLPSIRIFIDHTTLDFEKGALSYHLGNGLLREYAENVDGDATDVMVAQNEQELFQMFMGWLALHTDVVESKNRINLIGKNVGGFDMHLLKEARWATIKQENAIINIQFLDIGQFFLTDTDKRIPGLWHCMKRAGIDSGVTHTAVQDAADVIRLARTLYHD